MLYFKYKGHGWFDIRSPIYLLSQEKYIFQGEVSRIVEQSQNTGCVLSLINYLLFVSVATAKHIIYQTK